MKMMYVGKNEIEVSVVSLGTIGFGAADSPIDSAKKVQELIECFLENGINYIDTAAVYGIGSSEKLLGEALKHIRREDVILQTKCGLNWRETRGDFEYTREGVDVFRDLTPNAIRQDLEDSLKRLNTDYIDIYMTHRQQTMVALEDTIGELIKLKEEGKIRAIGASNVTTTQLIEYAKMGAVDVVQQKFSLLDSSAKEDIFPICVQYGIVFQGWGMLEHGALTGNTPAEESLPEVDPQKPVNGIVAWNNRNVFPYVKAFVEKWKDLSEKYNCSFANLVQALTLRQFDNMNLLIGQKSTKHILDTANAVNIELDQRDIDKMNQDVFELKQHELPLIIRIQ